MQDHHDLLPVHGTVAQDQRFSHHRGLLQIQMRVHPVAATVRQIESDVLRLSGRKRGLRHGIALLREGRREPVPMDDRGLCRCIHQPHVEALGAVELQARPTRGVRDAEDTRGLALHLHRARADGQPVQRHGGRCTGGGPAEVAREGRLPGRCPQG